MLGSRSPRPTKFCFKQINFRRGDVRDPNVSKPPGPLGGFRACKAVTKPAGSRRRVFSCNERGRQLRRPYVVGGSMSGARGVALDSSIWDRRLEAFSIRAAASPGSCVARANSTSVAAWRVKYCLPITIFSPFDYAAQISKVGIFVPAKPYDNGIREKI
jgi:hypothetical protein